MTIYIDFDRTLFDTGRLKTEISKRLLKRFSIAPDAIHDRLHTSAQRPFSSAHFAVALFPGDSKKQREGSHCIDTLLSQSRRFLYADAIPFLDALSRVHRLVLYSYGNRSFQMKKITASGIQKYFRKVIITPTSAKNILLPIPKGSAQACIIDDRPDVIAHYATRHGLHAFLIQRKRAPCGGLHTPFRAYRTLSSIQKAINTLHS